MEKDNKKHGIEETVSLEKIAEIVEMYIQEDDNIPEYDGYDVSVEEIEEETVVEQISDVEEKKKIIKKKKEFKSNDIKENIEDKESQIKEKTLKEKEVKSDFFKENKFKENEAVSVDSARGRVISKGAFSYLKKRYKSVDMIMGIALIAIIFSSGIGISNELPKNLVISKWNGITFGDLGIPMMILALCFMIPTEVEFDIKNKLNFKQIAIKKIKIGVALIFIGIIINFIVSGVSANFKIMGILQFIGIVYMLVSLVYVFFKRFKFKVNVIGIILIILGVASSVVYFMISNKFGYDMNNCLAYFVDSNVLMNHFKGVERLGVISVLSASFAGLLAAGGGSFICDRRSDTKDKSIRLLIVGMAFIIISLILEKKCPYNVNIWSPSFVMLVSGGFLILLSCMLIVFDSGRFRNLEIISTPLVVFGSSPMFLIAMNELLVKGIFKIKIYSLSLAERISLDKWIIVDILSQIFGESSRTIAFVLIYILIWFATTLFMYGKRIFIRIK